MIYEMRTYEAMPGKLRPLTARFANVTDRLFKKYGFRPVGYWTESVGDNTLFHYMLAWQDDAERIEKWSEFREDPEREGLLETPARVARAFTELTLGASASAGDHLSRVFAQDHAGDDVVLLKGIRFVSLCEHHMLPFTGVAHVAYLPSHGRVAGLSKLARTVDVFARRLQVQERLTSQIADALLEHLDPRGAAVVIEAEHSCLRLRGALKEDARMVTTAFRGALEHDRALRTEVLSLMGVGASR